jgi:UDP-glucose 4-epimerase
VDRALAGEPIEIFGTGEQTRCFCHVADTVRALRGLMDDAGTTGEIFNVGARNKTSIQALAERVIRLTGSSSEIVYVPYDRVYGEGIEDMLHREPDIAKIGAAVGWRPEHDLAGILDDVVAERSRLLSRPRAA